MHHFSTITRRGFKPSSRIESGVGGGKRDSSSAQLGEVRREGLRLEVDFATPHDEGAGLAAHPASATDYVYIYAYAPQWGGVLSTPAQRYEGRVSLELPTMFEGCEVQLYGFAWDRHEEASASVWLGVAGAGELA